MPSALDAPVLQVDANVIHKVDTSNPQNLFSMWTVFARCADNVAQGRRLENLSWRLWTRETFCVESTARLAGDRADRADSLDFGDRAAALASTHAPKEIPKRSTSSSDDIPQLSGSVDSAVDEEAVELTSNPSTLDVMRPHIRRQDSCGSNRSRGRERHITSDDLEKMVTSIVQGKELLTTPFPELAPFTYPTPEQPAAADAQESQEALAAAEPVRIVEPAKEPAVEVAATEAAAPAPEFEPNSSPISMTVVPSAAEIVASSYAAGGLLKKSKSTTEVIRGFSPSHLPLAIPQIHGPSANDDDDVIPDPMSAPQAKHVQSKKATFALGGSSSCEDSSMELRSPGASQTIKGKQPATASPAEEGSLKSAFHMSRHSLATKKQTSFSDHVTTRTIPSAPPVFDSDSESDIDESAIDDDEDDSSDWEDSNEDSRRNSIDEKDMFKRVDSSAHLPSRRSLLTLMMQRSEREVKNGLTTSQSTLGLPRARGQHQGPAPALATSPNDSDETNLTMRYRPRGPQPPSGLRPINEIPMRPNTQPIGIARSPRTNRRMMLSTELTESLRRHLLWERSQKTATANAVLKRRHTSTDVANLRQYPETSRTNDNGGSSSRINGGNGNGGGNGEGDDDDDDDDEISGSYDNYLNRDAYDGYHAKGW